MINHVSNRHERRKAQAISKKKMAGLNITSIDQHLNDMLQRVRAEFESTGEIRPVFECVTGKENFRVPATWPDRHAKAAAYTALRDSFRRRRVFRYVFATEAWVTKTPGLLAGDDPDRGECVQVIAAERNSVRRYAIADITRNGGAATLGPWQVNGEIPQSWLFELLEDGYSDRRPSGEQSPAKEVSASDLRASLDQHPEQADEIVNSAKLHFRLDDLIEHELQGEANGNAIAMHIALESILRSIVKEMGLQSVGECAHVLREHPDKFPMFPTVPQQVPSEQQVRRCKDALRCFSSEQRKLGNTPSALFGAFMNMYMCVGAQAIGALNLADRIEIWDPGHQAKLRQLGLRSCFELDDEEGDVFLALSPERYPIGVVGRRNAAGDLFVSELVAFPQCDFATAVDKIKQSGAELILGSEATELICKMKQVEGIESQNS